MKSSLQGIRVLNTRPYDQAILLSEQIRAHGGVSIECPTIEIQRTPFDWLEKVPSLDIVDHAIFISATAVKFGLKGLAFQNIIWPETLKAIAIGAATAKSLTQHHIPVDEIPEKSDSEHLIALKSLSLLKNKTLLLFKGEGGRTLIEEHLINHGAKVISLPVYKRVIPIICPKFLNSLWHDDAVNIILLTSELAIHNLFQLFTPEAHPWLRSKTCLVISPRLAKAASLWGMEKILTCEPCDIMNYLLQL